MTRNDDIERVLEQWFTEGPRHMSDRLFDGTFDQIDRLPRGRLADLQSRLPTMNLNLRLAAAAAVVILVAGAGLAVMNRVPRVGTPVSPSPSATRYVDPYFRPFGHGIGTFSASVPFESSPNSPNHVQLVNPFSPSGPYGSYINIDSGILPANDDRAHPCAAPFSAPRRTPAALAAWMRTFAELDVSPPKPVTVGGLSGVVVDVTGRPGLSETCGAPGTHRIEALAAGSWFYPNSKVRLILLDRGDGESILIDIGTRGEPTWASVDAAMSIVNGLEFTR